MVDFVNLKFYDKKFMEKIKQFNELLKISCAKIYLSTNIRFLDISFKNIQGVLRKRGT